MQSHRWKSILILAITLLAVYCVMPTIIYFLQPKEVRNDAEVFLSKVPSWLPQSHIKLGLDLQGGVQLVLGVDTSGSIANKLNRMAVEVSRWAGDKGYKTESAYVPVGEKRLAIVLGEGVDLGQFKVDLKKEFPILDSSGSDGKTLYYGYNSAEMERITKSALEQAERVVRNRVDRWGVTEPQINRRADGSISVQLPGFRDPQKAKELLGKTALLKFQAVDREFEGFQELKNLPEGVTQAANDTGQMAFKSESREDLIKFLSPHVPKDHSLLFSREELGDGQKGKYRWTSYVVFAQVELDGEDVREAIAGQSGELEHQPAVFLTFSGSGGRRFAEVTGKYVNKNLAIILDDVVESAPVITQKITGGKAEIKLGGMREYNKRLEEGQQLALILNSGAIPADIKVLEEREVGASLGPELANQGIMGTLVGLALVLMFMTFYYRRPGVIACIALLLNALFLLALEAGFGFALTLPGIAGFILTLGMAVDANVLINERIRQEISEGKHPRKAVTLGFDKVFWTIIDSNVTTLIAAAVLLETNASGPIRGFAITLIIGLLVSLFTALYCSKFMFQWAIANVPERKLKSWLGAEKKLHNFNIDFIKIGSTSAIVAILLSLFVIGTGFYRGVNFGVDFSGGTEVIVSFAKEINSEVLRDNAEKSGVKGVSIQALDGGKKQYLLRYDESSEDSTQVKASASDLYISFKHTLLEGLKDYQPSFDQVQFVGPQVGKELRVQGLLSVIYAILAVMLYIAFRFDMRFAPAALIKMVIDVTIMLGFYVFFWRSFDLVSVAAFLTVVGYSVNDTIVVYDRIRENCTLHPRRTLLENTNRAVNETFVRSINTSVTTGISLVGLLIFSSGQIWDFAMALAIGIVVATCSTTLVASTFVVWFERFRKSPASSTKVVASH